MPSFLLELFSEEIPARMQADAAEHLKQSIEASLFNAGYVNITAKTFVTPRRLAVLIRDIPAEQKDISTELKGPKIGAPEAALAGFLKKTGLNKDQLEERDGVYFALVEQKGRPTNEVLKPLLEEILAKFPWPKSMRWGSRDESWVRPLHSILCILGSDIVPLDFAGIKAGNTTSGHRFLSPNAITINNASEYAEKLKTAFVIADREERKAQIKASLEEKATARGLTVKEDIALLEEVVGLVEWPVVMFGKVDDQFMHLPPELLTTVMRSHQKYFTLNDKAGKFSSCFAFVANRDTKTAGAEIIAGNERVLRARFSDAKFFYEQDQKKTLSEWNTGLEKVIFHAKIGSVKDKTGRIRALANDLSDYIKDVSKADIQAATEICKADLVTGMVGEFPELQGIIGSYYAKAQGASHAIAEALYHLYDHPKDLKDLGPVAQILCMADRLDTMISLFAIGEKPTGSKDPYALRRAALGVIAIIQNHQLRMDLKKVLERTQAVYKAFDKAKDLASLEDELIQFFNDRLEADLLEQGIERTTLRAIGGLSHDSDIVRVTSRAKALQEFLKTSESAAMLAAYRRAANILAIEQKKDNLIYSAADLQQALLKEEAEKELHQALKQVADTIQPLFAAEDFSGVMNQFAGLKAPLDQFFNDIMVNTDDTALRKNRLCLLASIVAAMNQIADFSKIS